MLDRSERVAIARAVAEIVAENIASAKAEFRKELAEIRTQVESIPAPKEPPPIDIEAIAERAAVLTAPLVPKPQQGEPGKDADEDSIIEKVLLRIPNPENGKDAEPVDVEALYQRLVKAIPEPIPGPKGEKGDSVKGDKGEPGESIHGEPGESCDMAAVYQAIEAGLDARQEVVTKRLCDEMMAAFNSLPVPKDGEPGKPGESVHPDTVALMVREAVDKAFASVKLPSDGKPGEPGRDALQIEILPMIDETRSYPRGTFAKYKGGVIRSFRATDPGEPLVSGWEVIVDRSVFRIERSTDLRTYTFIESNLSGQIISKEEVHFPIPLDAGFYKRGDSYERGDIVQWDGTLWICQVDKTANAPGQSTDWRLAVKRPRDGKDGEKGEKGEPGPEGKPGKDLRYS